jgi:hypothetical protein
MLGNIILSIVFISVGIISVIFNKFLAHRFAAKFIETVGIILPSPLRNERFLTAIYRVIFYLVALFCAIAVILFLGSILPISK